MDELVRLAACFTDPESDLEARRRATDAIKDSQELWHTRDYPAFLTAFLEPLLSQLTSTPPQFEDSALQRLRHAVLEVLSKLPANEALRPHAPRLLDVCLSVLNGDNQANGLLAARMVLDINKNLVRGNAAGFEQHFTEFLAFVAKVYAEFSSSYNDAFAAEPACLPGDFTPTHRSLKLVAECPVPLMYIMQLFPVLTKARLPALLPSMLSAACMRGPEVAALPPVPAGFRERERERRERGGARPPGGGDNTNTAGVGGEDESVADKWREAVLSAVADLKTAQVRTLNLLTSLVRTFPAELEPQLSGICSALLDMFRSAPDCIAVRRELLAALRALLASQQRVGPVFASCADEVLTPGVLLGSGLASMDSLRPLTVTIFCEIVHNMRKALTLEQQAGVLSHLTCCIADASLPCSTQAMAVRLCLNLVECVYTAFKRPDGDLSTKQTARALLSRILSCFAARLDAMAKDLPTLLTAARAERTERLSVQSSLRDAGKQDTQGVVLYLQGLGEREREVHDSKLIFQNIVVGAKSLLFSILFCTRSYVTAQAAEAAAAAAAAAGAPPPPAPSGQAAGVGMPDDDVATCTRLLTAGLACLRLPAYSGEGKEFCEHFAEMFTVLDPRDFADVFSGRLPSLLEAMAADGDVLTVAAHLVQSPGVGRTFSALLARHLTDERLSALDDPRSADAALVQKLFRLVFLGLTLADGEGLLVPTLARLVRSCLEAAVRAREPVAYLSLLRILFKHCHAAKEPLAALHAELAPLLGGALGTLLAMLDGPSCGESLRHLLLELCLLLPAALRVLVEQALLPRLARPLALALRGPDELVSLGLRTFELWLDSLNPEYLEHALGHTATDVMAALWALLRPAHTQRPHALAAMQLLGKLGGRNRRFLREPPALDCRDNPEHGLRLILTFQPATSFLVPLDRCVALAKSGLAAGPGGTSSFGGPGVRGSINGCGSGAISSVYEPYYRGQALAFLQVCLSAVLNLRGADDPTDASPESRGSPLERLATVLLDGKHPPSVQPVASRVELGVKTKTQLVAERSVLVALLAATIGAAGDEQLREQATPFARAVCRHFALLFAAGAVAPPPAPLMARGSSTTAAQRAAATAAQGAAAAAAAAATTDAKTGTPAAAAAAAAGEQQQPSNTGAGGDADAKQQQQQPVDASANDTAQPPAASAATPAVATGEEAGQAPAAAAAAADASGSAASAGGVAAPGTAAAAAAAAAGSTSALTTAGAPAAGAGTPSSSSAAGPGGSAGGQQHGTALASATAPSGSAAAATPQQQALSAMPQGLAELDVHLMLDALIEVLGDASPDRAAAAVDALGVFLDTLLLVHRAARARSASPTGGGIGGSGSSGDVEMADAATTDEQQQQAAADAGAEGGKDASPGGGDPKAAAAAAKASTKADPAAKPEHAVQLGLPPVLDDLLPRLLHCCYAEAWPARLGGMSALSLLLDKLPADYLRAYGPRLLRALLAVVRWLPEHSSAELERAQAAIKTLLGRCYSRDQIPAQLLADAEVQAAADKEAAEKAAAEAAAREAAEKAAAEAAAAAAAAAAAKEAGDGEAAKEGDDKDGEAAKEEGDRPKSKEGSREGSPSTAEAAAAKEDVPSPPAATPSSSRKGGGTTRRGATKRARRSSDPSGGSADAETKADEDDAKDADAADGGKDGASADPMAVDAPDSGKNDADASKNAAEAADASKAPPPASSKDKEGGTSEPADGKGEAGAKQQPDAAAAAATEAGKGAGKDGQSAPPPPAKPSQYAMADAVVRARAKWASEAADVLLPVALAPSSTVCSRQTAAVALEHLGSLLDVHVGVWLGPALAGMTPPLMARRLIPVRSASTVLGQILALTWTLRTDAALFKPGPEAMQLTKEAYALADKEESVLLSRLPGRALTLELVGALRVAALELLDLLVAWDPYKAFGEQGDALRDEVIAMMFRALMSDSAPVHSAARSCLKRVMGVSKLPKHLLQNSLRPILTNLGDYRRLTLRLLHGLGRLLELLSDWFNLTLGERLIDHLKHWLDPDVLLKSGPFAWKSGEDVSIAAAMLDLFWRLPPPAVRFLQTQQASLPPGSSGGNTLGLVVLTIQLEERLARMPSPGAGAPIHPRVLSSEYRQPLLRFLNRFPVEGMTYFLDAGRLTNPSYANLLLGLLRMPEAGPLRTQLAASEGRLLKLFSSRTAIGTTAAPAAPAAAATPAAPAAPAQVDKPASEAAADGSASTAAPKQEAEPTEKAEEPAAAGGGEAGAPQEEAAPADGAAQPVKLEQPAATTPQAGTPPPAAAVVATAPGAASYHAVQLVELMVQQQPDWLPARQAVFEALWARWRDTCDKPRPMAREALLPELQLRDAQRVAGCMLAYLSSPQHHTLVEPLLDLFAALAHPGSADLSLIPAYVTRTVNEAYSIPHRRALLLGWATRFTAFCAELPELARAAGSAGSRNIFTAGTGTTAELVQVSLLTHLALPMLTPNPEAAELLDAQLLDVLADVFRTADANASAFGEPLRIRVLQLAVALVKAALPALQAHKGLRDAAIKCAWHHLRVPEESPCRHWAFLAMVHLLPLCGGSEARGGTNVDGPVAKAGAAGAAAAGAAGAGGRAQGGVERMVAQVWVSLLRVTQLEPRKGLMREVLDALVPTLEDKLGGRGDDGKVIWVRYAKKQVLDENGTLTNLLQLWQLVVRHPDVFYESRGQFSSQMINCLSRIGMPHQASSENRRLSLDLAGLLLSWEAQRRAQAGETAESTGASPPGSSRKRAKPDDGGGSARGGDDVEMADASAAAEQQQQQPAKLVKTESGAAPAAAAGSEAAGSDSGGADDVRLSPDAQSMLVNFLVRMAFLLGEGQERDLDVRALYIHALRLLRQALRLFPHVSVRLSNFLERLLQAQAQRSPMPALVTGWEVMARALEANPTLLARSCGREFVQLLGPCFRLRQPHVLELVCSVVRQLFELQPWQENSPRAIAAAQAAAAEAAAAAAAAAPVAADPAAPTADDGAAASAQAPAAVKQEPGGDSCTVAAPQSAPQEAPADGVAAPAAATPPPQGGAAVAAVAPEPTTVHTPAVAAAAAPDVAQPVDGTTAPAAASEVTPQVATAQPAQAPPAAPVVPPGSPDLDQDIWELQSAVLQHVRQHIARGTDPQQALLVVSDPATQAQGQQAQPAPPTYASSDALLGVCTSLSMLTVIHEVCPEALVSAHLPPLLKLLNRCARDACTSAPNGQMHQRHYHAAKEAAAAAAASSPETLQGKASSAADTAIEACKKTANTEQGNSKEPSSDAKDSETKATASDGGAEQGNAVDAAVSAGAAAGPGAQAPPARAEPAAAPGDLEAPVYATVAWVLDRALVLVGARAFPYAELKKVLLQSVIIIVTAVGAKYNEPLLFMRILLLYREWVKLPPSLLTIKEAVLLLQRLAYVQDRFDVDPAAGGRWHALFLDTVYDLCTSSDVPPELPGEVFAKVERLFLLGLRAPDPARRAAFFTLYHQHLSAGLFERLQFIICAQEWQSMAGCFWLKAALDLVLAVLKAGDAVMLAPNSAHAPPLLPGTRSNVYVPSATAAAAARGSAGGGAAQGGNGSSVSGAAAAAATAAPAAAGTSSQAKPATPAADASTADAPAPAAAGEAAAPANDGAQAMEVDTSAAAGAAGAAAAPPPASAANDAKPPADAAAQPAPSQQQEAAADDGKVPAVGDSKVQVASSTAASSSGKPPVAPQTASGGGTAAPAQQTPAAATAAAPVQSQPPPLLPAMQQVPSSPGPPPQLPAPPAGEAFPVTVRESDVEEQLQALLREHVAFLDAAAHLSVRSLMAPLMEYAQVDPHVSHHLWVLIFPIVWATLAKQQQVNLAKPIISLLSKEYHQRQAMARPNVVQALLEAISLSQPQPKVPPELIRFLGRAFNAWPVAIPLLESHVVIFPDETRCFDALAELYRLVGEEDMLAGLWRRRCANPGTRVALSLQQLGMLERAQAMFAELNGAVASGAVKPSPRGELGGADIVPRGEIASWVEGWVSASKALTQWDVLADYARATDNLPLAMDCLWRLHDWEMLQGMLAQNQGQMEPAVSSCLLSAYAALREADTGNAYAHIDKGYQYALAKWWQLPEQGTSCHLGLLQTFQQLVELRESGRVLADVMSAGQRPDAHYNDTREILETWRLRTPNEWDSLVHWQDVLLWRNHIYNVVISAFNNLSEVAPQLHQMGYRDKAWSVNRLGHVAYKHGCPDVCITIINNMYGYNAMEVQEAFVKIREQARAYLALPHDLRAGLNMLNTTNLDYFAHHHQAEIFRLKAMFMAEPGMNDQEGAHSALSTALCLWRQCPDAWLSWGQLCDARYEEAPQGPASLQMLRYAAHCYVQGLRLSTAPPGASGLKARNEEALTSALDLLPRLLHLLSFDDREGVVGEELSKAVEERSLPPWVWFAWIPQLLTSLTRPEARRVKPILRQLAETHPQSLYCSLRTFVLTLREAAQRGLQEFNKQRTALEAQVASALEAAGGDAENEAVRSARAALAALTPAPEALAFDAGKEVMERLRATHGPLAATLEALLGEVGGRFTPRPLERLLAVVTALLHRCYKVPLANNAPVPPLMRTEMAGVCNACFSSDSSKLQAATLSGPVLRSAFMQDLNPESPSFPATLWELVERLKAWRNRLQMELEAAMPSSLHLETESRALLDMPLGEVELPGQYLAGHEVPPEAVVHLEGVGACVDIVRRSGTSYRRLRLLCSDGLTRHMLVLTGQNSTQGQADERLLQLLRLLNRLLERHPEARRRGLAWHTPAVVPVWPQVRLVEDEPSYFPYGEAYDINCARYGREPDMPILLFKRRLATPEGTYAPDPDYSLRLSAYTEICERVVSESIFNQYIYKTLPAANHVWMFRRTLTAQLALSGLLCHTLLLPGRVPGKILIAKDSGRLLQLELLTLYNERGLVERIEVVPYRLTRNLQVFLSSFGVEGLFVPAQAAAAAALLSPSGNLSSALSMFFREDVLAWLGRKARGAGSGAAGSQLPAATLKRLVSGNVSAAAERLRHFAPARVGEDELPRAPVHQSALELAEAATSPKLLCRQDPTWHPWF